MGKTHMDIIDDMLRISYKAIEELQRELNVTRDRVKVSKAIARLSEDIRKLLKVRISLLKEEKNDGTEEQLTDTINE